MTQMVQTTGDWNSTSESDFCLKDYNACAILLVTCFHKVYSDIFRANTRNTSRAQYRRKRIPELQGDDERETEEE